MGDLNPAPTASRPTRPPLLRGLLIGWVAAAFGLGLARLVAVLAGTDATPLVVVGSAFVDRVPPWLKEFATSTFGTADKAVLVAGMVVVLVLLSGAVGVLATRRRALAMLALAIAAIGVVAAVSRPDYAAADLWPSVFAGVGAAVSLRWMAGHAGVRRLLPGSPETMPFDRREFLTAVGITAAGAVVGGVLARIGEGAGKAVEAARAALAIPAAPARLQRYENVGALPPAPEGTSAVKGIATPWRTPNTAFYRIDTQLSVPAVDPMDWSLTVTGMVDREITVTLADLMARPVRHRWVTLACVSNPVGGDLVGNALWTGTPVADLLADCGVHDGADAVLQTSDDGWTCATPLEALTDPGRNALLAYGMNGEPLPREHGFPLRMVVPGLYGYVSATKWLVRLEVTRFDQVTAYWTERGWSERGPVKLESRIDTPAGGAEEGDVLVTGTAWLQHVGIGRVEVRVDEGPWQEATLGGQPTVDSWRLWSWLWEGATPGDHTLQCRAVDADGNTQTEERVDVVPDGATGWDTVSCYVVPEGTLDD